MLVNQCYTKNACIDMNYCSNHAVVSLLWDFWHVDTSICVRYLGKTEEAFEIICQPQKSVLQKLQYREISTLAVHLLHKEFNSWRAKQMQL
jgi:hypothetical protein